MDECLAPVEDGHDFVPREAHSGNREMLPVQEAMTRCLRNARVGSVGGGNRGHAHNSARRTGGHGRTRKGGRDVRRKDGEHYSDTNVNRRSQNQNGQKGNKRDAKHARAKQGPKRTRHARETSGCERNKRDQRNDQDHTREQSERGCAQGRGKESKQNGTQEVCAEMWRAEARETWIWEAMCVQCSTREIHVRTER